MRVPHHWSLGYASVVGFMLLGGCGLAELFGRQEVQESLRHVTFYYHIRNNIPDAELNVINRALANDPGRINDAAVLDLTTQPVCEVTDRTLVNLDMNGDPAKLAAGSTNTNTFELSSLGLQDASGGVCPLDAVGDLVFLSDRDIHIDRPMPVSTLEIKYGGDLFTAAGQHARVVLEAYSSSRFATGTFQFLAKRQCSGLSGSTLNSCRSDNRVLIVVKGVFADVD